MVHENKDKYITINANENERLDEKKIESKSSFLEKLKDNDLVKKFSNIKGIKIVVPLILLVLVLTIYYSFFNDSSKKTSSFSSISYTSSLEYSQLLEDKLKSVLSNIKGAGNVNVMITLESGPELKIATQTDERTNTTTNASGTTTSITVVEEPIIITQNGEETPLVLMEILPVVKGVVVVAEGAKDVGVKLQLLEAVQALLSLSSGNIQILTGI